MRRMLERILKRAPEVKLGRWKLKHKCGTEEIAVLNANRDHCGDRLCGDPEEYKRLREGLRAAEGDKTARIVKHYIPNNDLYIKKRDTR
jgi:hypothetical protein